VGVPGKPPFWRTLSEFCKGLGPVTLKINTQHTHTSQTWAIEPRYRPPGQRGIPRFWVRDYGVGGRVGRPYGAR
jgi:hypothetical protein